MTAQKIEDIIFEEFEDNKNLKKTHNPQTSITNTINPNPESWTSKIVSAINISDLAKDNGIDRCPKCDYDLYFDDGRGWFICAKARFDGSCNFKGNIVDFMEEVG